ncbi:MAG: ribose-phosphate pyrophosphokinae, partial [Patescibacteria group bacterium]|nr:ribose-phosphate pyrophosphokinae [Patescibacteria group bacterium]
MKSNSKIFGGTASEALAKQIAKGLRKANGKIVMRRFSDGEFSPYFNESIRGSDVFLVQSTFSPTENLFELIMLIDAA